MPMVVMRMSVSVAVLVSGDVVVLMRMIIWVHG
jgi:hypothetical protein